MGRQECNNGDLQLTRNRTQSQEYSAKLEPNSSVTKFLLETCLARAWALAMVRIHYERVFLLDKRIIDLPNTRAPADLRMLPHRLRPRSQYISAERQNTMNYLVADCRSGLLPVCSLRRVNPLYTLWPKALGREWLRQVRYSQVKEGRDAY